ncbi:MAG TPA: hypothetical protein VE736_08145 [Gaiellaceae bacterium]|nr:hypothetical protein [Gaiellaceae bacterium]
MGRVIANVAAIVCGASFSGLPAGWHQSRPWCTTSSNGISSGNTFTWAATPHSVDNLIRFPSSGIYIWVSLNRSTRRVSGRRLHVPLRLTDATILQQEGRPRLPELRFEGRYQRRYDATIGVDFGRPHPSPAAWLAAQRALNAIVWPRWP